jgi:hypothetical protein
MRLSELRAAATAMHDVGQAILTPGLGGLVVRFLLHKSAAATAG